MAALVRNQPEREEESENQCKVFEQRLVEFLGNT